jgi:hypothetical protein
MKLLPALLFALVFCSATCASVSAIPAAESGVLPASAPQTVSLPSEAPSGIEVNDRIWFDFYPTKRAAGYQAPAVILLHYLGSTGGQ